MSASLRFLALALVGWVGVRAATLGHVPGAELFTIDREERDPAPPAIAQTQFPPIEPAMLDYGAAPPPPPLHHASVPTPVPFYYRVPVPVAAPVRQAQPLRLTEIVPVAAPVFFSPVPQLDSWPLGDIARGRFAAPRRSVVTGDQQSVPAAIIKPRLDRLQLTAWALLRGQPGPDSLASGGTLGGSQTGARLTYNVNRWLAGSLRATAPVGGSAGGEIAGGIRVRPIPSIPVAITAERRQAIGNAGGGRSEFALFAEGGLYQRPIGWNLLLDGYAQGGVVGIRSRDLFVDGGLTLTRPLFGDFSAGLGIWGGAQPGLYRVDAGPRLTMRVRGSMRVHLDWRQRLVGNAAPGSGPAVTLGADF